MEDIIEYPHQFLVDFQNLHFGTTTTNQVIEYLALFPHMFLALKEYSVNPGLIIPMDVPTVRKIHHCIFGTPPANSQNVFILDRA